MQGNFGLHQELKCPLDGYDLIFWTTAARGTPLCPYCYNNPPFPDMPKNAPCMKCTHPSCPHSMVVNAVRTCYGCETGILVLETSAGLKKRISCNQCSLKIYLGEQKKVKVKSDSVACGQCGGRTMTLEDKEGVEKTGCIFCEENVSGKCRVDYRGPRERTGGRNRRARGGLQARGADGPGRESRGPSRRGARRGGGRGRGRGMRRGGSDYQG